MDSDVALENFAKEIENNIENNQESESSTFKNVIDGYRLPSDNDASDQELSSPFKSRFCDTSWKPKEDSNWVPSPVAAYSSPFTNCLPCSLSWSPDGSQLAVTSDDAKIRIFTSNNLHTNNQSTESYLTIKETEFIYDFDWCHSSSRLAASGRYQPIHLWNVADGRVDLVATYKCINQLDELSHAYSVTVSESGELLYAGLKGELRVFDVNKPGKESYAYKTGSHGQTGILSSIALNSSIPVLAAGCYNRTTGLYSTQSGQLLCLLKGERGGVTHVEFSADGTKLFTGGRKDNEIVIWDLRQPGKVISTLQREVTTNQRIQFSISSCDKYLVSANTDGSVRLWDLAKSEDAALVSPQYAWLLHGDAVAGIDWHPDGHYLASCSGQRHFYCDSDNGDDNSDEETRRDERIVRIWSLN